MGGFNMKRKQGLLIALLLTTVVLLVVGCNSFSTVSNINDLVDLNSVNSIAIVDGSNGNITELTDTEVFKDIIQSLDKLKLTKIDREDSTGWSFAIQLKTDKSIDKLTFIDSHLCEIDGSNYSIENVDSKLLQFFDME